MFVLLETCSFQLKEWLSDRIRARVAVKIREFHEASIPFLNREVMIFEHMRQ
jgi:hypothetical protein